MNRRQPMATWEVTMLVTQTVIAMNEFDAIGVATMGLEGRARVVEVVQS